MDYMNNDVILNFSILYLAICDQDLEATMSVIDALNEQCQTFPQEIDSLSGVLDAMYNLAYHSDPVNGVNEAFVYAVAHITFIDIPENIRWKVNIQKMRFNKNEEIVAFLNEFITTRTFLDLSLEQKLSLISLAAATNNVEELKKLKMELETNG